MALNTLASRGSRVRIAAVAGGVALAGLGTGCTPEEMRAAIAGLDAVARILSDLNQSQDEDINFGDWLADELKN